LQALADAPKEEVAHVASSFEESSGVGRGGGISPPDKPPPDKPLLKRGGGKAFLQHVLAQCNSQADADTLCSKARCTLPMQENAGWEA
jgi:hypothetical protein